ncbi:hypothetical protein ACA910_002607 [Epithemia clementina (nom. ined.)]
MALFEPHEPTKVGNIEKAAKNDDAEVPVELWNERIAYLLDAVLLSEQQNKAAELLCCRILSQWRQSVCRSWRRWWTQSQDKFKSTEDCNLVKQRGQQAIRHAMQATLWSWPNGSSVFFWRWPYKYQRNVAMGVAPM